MVTPVMAPPNVLWITLDSVRADHTSIDGYERDTTPRLAALGEEGRAFPNWIAHSKATHRYQQSEDESELFALPDEETDVQGDEPQLDANLSSKLEGWLAEHGEPIDRGIEGKFSSAVERQLRDLGYVD